DLKPSLLAKYLAMMKPMVALDKEKWSSAKSKVFTLVRDARDSWTLPLRLAPGSVAPIFLEFPFVSHLSIRIGLDLGPNIAQVSEDYLKTWSITADVARQQAQENFLTSITNQEFSWAPLR